jgi:hypothetical protein
VRLQTRSGASRYFRKQETLHSLLRTGWFQEKIRKLISLSLHTKSS